MERGQPGKWTVIATQDMNGTNPGAGIPGIADELHCQIWGDGQIKGALSNPSELQEGYYIFDIPASWTGHIQLTNTPEPIAGVPNATLKACPEVIYTTPPNFSRLGIDSTGDLQEVLNVVNVQRLGLLSISDTSFSPAAIQAGAIADAAFDDKGNWNIGREGYSLATAQSFNNTGQTTAIPASGDWASEDELISLLFRIAKLSISVETVLDNQTRKVAIPVDTAPPTELDSIESGIWSYKLLHAKRDQNELEETIFAPGGTVADLRRDKNFDEPTKTVSIGELEKVP